MNKSYRILSPIKYGRRVHRDGEIDLPADLGAKLVGSGHVAELPASMNAEGGERGGQSDGNGAAAGQGAAADQNARAMEEGSGGAGEQSGTAAAPAAKPAAKRAAKSTKAGK
jgi:hypothetical protein